MKILAHTTYVGHTGYNSHCQNFFRNLSRLHDVKVRNFTVGKNWSFSNISGDAHKGDVEEQDKEMLAIQSLWGENGQLEDFDIYGFNRDEYRHDLNIVLAEVAHHYFYQDYVGPKIAYTVWENTLYPEGFFDQLKTYDQVWVPSKWQAEITINQGIKREKVKVVPEGVDTRLFYPRAKDKEDGVFRFAIFGRWDARKGTKETIQAFKNVFGDNPKVELLLSVDNPFSSDGTSSTEDRLKKYDLECSNIKILHFPSREKYVKMLSNSDVFLSCSRSEGWNLPLIEAMACGVPSIYSDCSGQLEFAKGKGIPVSVLGESSPKEIKDSYCETSGIASGNWYEPDFEDLEKKILYAFENHSSLKTQALLDAQSIRKEFSWSNAAVKANSILKDFSEGGSEDDYAVNFLRADGDRKSVFFFTTSTEPRKVVAEIFDEFTGFAFFRDEMIISSANHYFVSHAYIAPNQILKVSDYHSGKVKLEYRMNSDMSLGERPLDIRDRDLASLLPEKVKNHPSLGFSFFEIYHRNTYSFKKCKIESGDVVFDLGSCFGLFSRRAFSDGASEVHAFEPNKGLSESNLILNKGQNFFFNDKAVYSKNVKFVEKPDLVGSWVEESDSGKALNIDVNSYIADKGINKIDYLKIDIEGSEYDLFENIDKTFLANNVRKIALEYHNNLDGRVQKILTILTSCGFTYEFESEENRSKELGMLYAWKSEGFNFNAFFDKYRELIEKSGVSRLRFYEHIIPKLVAKNKPLHVIETGTMWAPLKDNMGAFTIVMADLIKNHTGGKLYTVDISEKSINSCKEYTKEFSSHIEYVLSDSVSYLQSLTDDFVFDLDLIYLDSFDFNVPAPHESANHHMRELSALYGRMNYSCPIAVDDNFLPNTYIIWDYYDNAGNIIKKERFETGDSILGKGMYCHKFLIDNGWTRFEAFDVCGANNLFYYEKQKLSVEQAYGILNNFYEENKIVLPTTNHLVDESSIYNAASGLGDALILTALLPEKSIYSSFKGFEGLMDCAGHKFQKQNKYFDIDSYDLHKFDWRGGHCIQRLQAAFLGRRDAIPKPSLNKRPCPRKGRVAFHFSSSKRRETAMPPDIQTAVLNFLLDSGYSLYDCSSAADVKGLIDEMSTCEYFVGINSGPMHIAAAFEIKSIVIIDARDSEKIYLPKLEEAKVLNSEWLYPQNTHLTMGCGNELVEKFSIGTLRNAIAGNLYPYFSYEFLKGEYDFKWSFEKDCNKLNFSFGEDLRSARIILKEKNKNLKCFDWSIGNIDKGVNYFIVPTSNMNLLSLDFEGFVFSLYLNSELVLERDLSIRKPYFPSKVKYFSSKETDLTILDSFYIQYSDFYNNKFLKKCLEGKRTVLDIGASCGSFVDICLQNGVGKVVALEPSRSFEILDKTFKNDSRVTCINKALSTNCSAKNLLSSGHSTLSSFEMESQKRFDSAKLIEDERPISVSCTDLATLREESGLASVDLLKIDIEGFEYELFKAFDSSNLNSVSEILVEYHHNENEKILSIIKKLENLGYGVSLMGLNYERDSSLKNTQGVIYAQKNRLDVKETEKEQLGADLAEIVNESGSLGDAIAWIPVVNEFAIQKNKKVNLYTPFKDLFQKEYPLINFHDYSNKPRELTKNDYILSCSDSFDWKALNLQEIASKILGLPHKEVLPKITLPEEKETRFKKKYVCIATQSTSQCKYWNNEDGWVKIVDYLKSIGYDVVCIDKHPLFGAPGAMNEIPYNCIDDTGEKPLSDRIKTILGCEFFIGLSSGLSWLAWACKKKCIMISGFTDAFHEFQSKYRIINKKVCNSCWHDPSLKFDASNWLWCPRKKNFECSKEISYEMVKEKIDICIEDLSLES